MNATKYRRRSAKDKPTIDEFHQILRQLTPNHRFTAASVDVLRTVYFSYLGEIASSLVKYDKISNDDGIIAKACSLEESTEFQKWTDEAISLLKGSDSGASAVRPKQKRKAQITAAMEAEQDRLLEKSKAAMAQRFGNK